MAAIITAGVFFGDFLDSRVNITIPVCTIMCSLLSIFLSLYYVFKKAVNKSEKK